MDALITGSMAFDTLMNYPDAFEDALLPDKLHMLNVSFLVPQLQRNVGGCAGNIAYGLAQLGAQAAPFATVGKDFAPYQQWLADHHIPTDYLRVLDDHYTAQAYITTDKNDNQITAFHPGAMNEAHQLHIPTDAGVKLGIVSPDGREGMISHAREFAEAGIPFIFDPGQGLPMFDGDDLLTFADQATWLAMNEYEAELAQDKTGLSRQQLAARVDAFIVTRAAQGSTIYVGDKTIDIEAAQPTAVTDPTGCGDAYRAGLIYGLLNGMDWETTGRVASLMGAIKVAHAGPQNYAFTPDTFARQFQQQFGYTLG